MPHGKACYLEIPAIAAEASADFYRGIFGWTIRKRGAGGRVLTPRTDIAPASGALAVFADPAGTEFGLCEEPSANEGVSARRRCADKLCEPQVDSRTQQP